MRERKRRNFNQGYKGNILAGRFSGTAIVIGILGALVLFSVLQINQQSVRGYRLSELETKKAELIAEKDRLEVEATRLQSLQEIQKSNGNTGTKLVPIQKINFLPTTNVAVK